MKNAALSGLRGCANTVGGPSWSPAHGGGNFSTHNTMLLYPSPIFGPVHSRRLGVSLGINLLPADGKVCTFDCIYCECGFNAGQRPRSKMPTREEVARALENKLREMTAEGVLPDVLTFAGNGEPTLHPHFAEIVDDVLVLRDGYCPKAKVSLLSNATMAHRADIHAAMMRIDNNILKLDTVARAYIYKVDRPLNDAYDVNKMVDTLRSFAGHVIIQTMFMCGESHGESIDNTGDEYVEPWLRAIESIRPGAVMIYTIDRETPDKGLLKASPERLDDICRRVKALGISCTASY